MLRYGRKHHGLAVGLAWLAGFVDALGFLKLGGMFVSFMSGNSTRLGVGLVLGSSYVATSLTLIAAFVAGVTGGAIAGRAAGRWRKPVVLGCATLLLLVAALLNRLSPGGIGATCFMAVAMGATNNAFQRDGEVSIGVTYMTGTLVKFGQHLAAILYGGSPAACLPYLFLWMGFMLGAVGGAASFARFDLEAIWIGVACSALLTFAAIAIVSHR